MEFKNKHKIQKLKELIQQELTPLITNNYVLLDVPNHRNIGDNLIWKGELDFLREIPFKKLYSANMHTYQYDKVSKDATILLHGGGNFGDFYVASQTHRNNIIKSFPKNNIIVFPQTIYYKDEQNLRKDSVIFNNHKNLTICVRDLKSQQLLSKYIPVDKIKLLPDMAFCMNLEKFHSSIKTEKSLYMKRMDGELNLDFKTQFIFNFLKEGEPKLIEEKDWPTFSNSPLKNKINSKRDAVENKASKMLLKLPLLKNLVNDEFGLNPKSNMDKHIRNGIKFLNSYDKIATTRLHGFILSVLLNKEVGIVDNSYGKNSNFYNTWMQDFDKISLIQK